MQQMAIAAGRQDQDNPSHPPPLLPRPAPRPLPAPAWRGEAPVVRWGGRLFAYRWGGTEPLSCRGVLWAIDKGSLTSPLAPAPSPSPLLHFPFPSPSPPHWGRHPNPIQHNSAVYTLRSDTTTSFPITFHMGTLCPCRPIAASGKRRLRRKSRSSSLLLAERLSKPVDRQR